MNEYIDILIAIIVTCVAIGFILALLIFVFLIYIEIKDYLEDKLWYTYSYYWCTNS